MCGNRTGPEAGAEQGGCGRLHFRGNSLLEKIPKPLKDPDGFLRPPKRLGSPRSGHAPGADNECRVNVFGDRV